VIVMGQDAEVDGLRQARGTYGRQCAVSFARMGVEHGGDEHIASHAANGVKMNAPGYGGFRH
jgi:hypothetical protein